MMENTTTTVTFINSTEQCELVDPHYHDPVYVYVFSNGAMFDPVEM